MRRVGSESHVCRASIPFEKRTLKGISERRLLGASVAYDASKHRPHRVSSRRVAPVRCLVDIVQTNFKEEVLQSEMPVLIDFWASWCGPCKLLDPTMKWLEEEYDGQLKVVKLDVDQNPDIVEKYKVYGLPTIMLFKGGKVMERSQREGAITRDDIVAYLDQFGIVPNRTASQ